LFFIPCREKKMNSYLVDLIGNFSVLDLIMDSLLLVFQLARKAINQRQSFWGRWISLFKNLNGLPIIFKLKLLTIQ